MTPPEIFLGWTKSNISGHCAPCGPNFTECYHPVGYVFLPPIHPSILYLYSLFEPVLCPATYPTDPIFAFTLPFFLQLILVLLNLLWFGIILVLCVSRRAVPATVSPDTAWLCPDEIHPITSRITAV